MWFICVNKVFTWDYMQSRIWQGPSKCPLYKVNDESLIHVVVLTLKPTQFGRNCMEDLVIK